MWESVVRMGSLCLAQKAWMDLLDLKASKEYRERLEPKDLKLVQCSA